MQYFRNKYETRFKGITLVLSILMGLHFLGVHSFAENLVYCFEESGQVSIKSKVGSFLTSSSDKSIHDQAPHEHDRVTFDVVQDKHDDISLTLVCSKEQKVTRSDQQQIIKNIGDSLSKIMDELPPLREFHFTSFISPLIEDLITSNLQTVVLLN